MVLAWSLELMCWPLLTFLRSFVRSFVRSLWLGRGDLETTLGEILKKREFEYRSITYGTTNAQLHETTYFLVGCWLITVLLVTTHYDDGLPFGEII